MQKINKIFETLVKTTIGLFGLMVVFTGATFTYFGNAYEAAEAAFPLFPLGIIMIFGGLSIIIYDAIETIKDTKVIA